MVFLTKPRHTKKHTKKGDRNSRIFFLVPDCHLFGCPTAGGLTRADRDRTKDRMKAAVPLFFGHWLSAWGDRMWQFATPVLFMDIFLDTLAPAALYGVAVYTVAYPHARGSDTSLSWPPRLACVSCRSVCRTMSGRSCRCVCSVSRRRARGSTGRSGCV